MLVAFGFIGGEFFPPVDRGQFLVQMELPKDATIEKTNQITLEVEKFLRKDKDVVDSYNEEDLNERPSGLKSVDELLLIGSNSMIDFISRIK